jgi:uridine monophosphate synthetase
MVEANVEKRKNPEGMTLKQEEFCHQLLDIEAVKFGNFKLKLHDIHPEAPLSPIYVDERVLRRFLEAKYSALDMYQELMQDMEFDLLADVPTSITPIVSSLSDRLGIGMITPRTDSKSHGTGAKIDGLQDYDKGKEAALFDDVITTGTSLFEALDILGSQGVKVKHVFLGVDREQGGKKKLEEKGYVVHVGLTMTQVLDYALRIGKISNETLKDTKQRLEVLNTYIKA